MSHSTQSRANRQQRTKSILLVHAGGHIQLFGDQLLDVRVIDVPHVQSVRAEILIEQWIESELPRPYRDIYFPGNLRASGNVRTDYTVADLADREYDLGFVAGLNELQDKWTEAKEGDVVWIL